MVRAASNNRITFRKDKKVKNTFKICSQITRGFLLIALFAAAIYPQATNGRLEGTVKDASGGLVPDATVIVVNQRTNQERTATTNDEGFFAVAELAPGDYTVKIEAANFRVTNISDVIVAVGTPATVNIELVAGSISETSGSFRRGRTGSGQHDECGNRRCR